MKKGWIFRIMENGKWKMASLVTRLLVKFKTSYIEFFGMFQFFDLKLY